MFKDGGMGEPAHHQGQRGQCSHGKAHTLTTPELRQFLEKNMRFFAVNHTVEMLHSAERTLTVSVAKRTLNNRSDSQAKRKTL